MSRINRKIILVSTPLSPMMIILLGLMVYILIDMRHQEASHQYRDRVSHLGSKHPPLVDHPIRLDRHPDHIHSFPLSRPRVHSHPHGTENPIKQLHSQGYYKIDRVWDQNSGAGLQAVNQDGTVDYHAMKRYIDTQMLPAINNAVPVIPNPIYGKFRFSDNNNSTDAALHHGDIYNHTDQELIPIYTCLIYFDDAEVEVVPGTHHLPTFKETSTAQKWAQKKKLQFRPGDMLIFHANLHHRGVGYSPSGHRRILQVFNIFPNREIHAIHNPRLHTMQTSQSFWAELGGKGLKTLATMPMMINVACIISYVLVCNSWQYKLALADIPSSEKQGRYLSYEPGKNKRIELCSRSEPVNVNIVCDPEFQKLDPSTYYLKYAAIMMLVQGLGGYAVYRWNPMKRRRGRK